MSFFDMIHLQLQQDARNRRLHSTISKQPAKKLSEKTMTGYSFDKLAKHAHRYAAQNKGAGWPACTYEAGRFTFNREIMKFLGLDVCGLSGYGKGDRKTLIKIINHLYTK